MRDRDKKYFLEAAHKFNAWIIVRLTNPKSMQYIGMPGYWPKRIDCKAKTAASDIGVWKLAGLVVDPNIHPGAFKPAKLADAKSYWQKMHLGGAYTLDQDQRSKHYGCLRCEGKYIHGDYDLFDVIDVTQAHRNLAVVETLLGQPHMRGWLVNEVQAYVNQRIGVPMIQHGGEAQYADFSEQSLDAFGPNGEDVTILNEFSVRHWYQTTFGGRQVLGG